jgi:hypothetical protein
MRKVTFHEDADAEMNDAAHYYEERAFGLGLSFLDAVEDAVDKVRENPEAYQLVGDEVRHKLLIRFHTVFSMLSNLIVSALLQLHTKSVVRGIGAIGCK